MKKKTSIIVVIVLTIIALASILFVLFGVPRMQFKTAQSELEAGNRYQAYALIEKLEHKNLLKEERYQYAVQLFKDADYDAASLLFKGLNNYKYCASQINEIKKIGRKSEPYVQEHYKFLMDAKAGDVITFGSYEQDNNVKNGKEPIEWIVLSRRNGKLLVISKYALDCRMFDASGKDVSWKDSDLRLWLNSSFYNSAFSSNDQSYIEYSYLGRYKGSENESDVILYDYVSVLSEGEASSYYKTDAERKVTPTEYAKSRGAFVSEEKSSNGCCWWWLRSDGGMKDTTIAVHHLGNVYGGIYSNMDFCTVRPTMWLVEE